MKCRRAGCPCKEPTEGWGEDVTDQFEVNPNFGIQLGVRFTREEFDELCFFAEANSTSVAKFVGDFVRDMLLEFNER